MTVPYSDQVTVPYSDQMTVPYSDQNIQSLQIHFHCPKKTTLQPLAYHSKMSVAIELSQIPSVPSNVLHWFQLTDFFIFSSEKKWHLVGLMAQRGAVLMKRGAIALSWRTDELD
jgi:hypothetical protein